MNSKSLQCVLACCLVWIGTAVAEPVPRHASNIAVSHADMVDNVPMAHYLVQLAQVSPIAREAAELYLYNYGVRCGRAMSALELRRAVRANDRVLMGMLTRMSQGDKVGAQTLTAEMDCRGQ